ncbi:MAG: twitching motility protein, partial [Geminicoccaceae bacterium]|nr:twitching motility protein [Geminicoccaceae bacterium]
LMSTLHTQDAVTTIMRIIAMFPPEEQDVVRIRIAESLNAVISQRLLPRKDGNGRVVASEVMVVTPAIRDLILESRIGEIRDFIADGRETYQMQTFDQHLVDLVNSGVVSFEVAKAASSRPADFELEMKMLSSGPEAANGNHDNDGGIPGLVPTALSAPEPSQRRGKRR